MDLSTIQVPLARGSLGLQQLQYASAFSTYFHGYLFWKRKDAFEHTSCGPLRSSSSRIVSSLAADPQVDSKPLLASKSIKRKVAMWVGYVGTHYKGLQIQRSSAVGQTIEQELETAIFRVGGILESNFGSLDKIRWMRSSRTDKGVHSLSTVISFKMEVEQGTWGNGEDGIEVADRINQYLPNTIRIFGIVPVNKSFDPRRGCCSRTYHYLLPASIVGITQYSHAEEVQQRIVKFQTILSSLEGQFPYHNYTVRSHYRKKVSLSSKSDLKKGNAIQKEEKLFSSELDSDSGDDESHFETLAGNPGTLSLLNCTPSFAPPKIRWLYELDIADKISSAHFRKIFSFTCGGLETYEGLCFLKLTIHGESFMLHQIRKMVGTAVAIMRDVLPSDIIPVSLSCPCRVALPLAPSEGLFLASNEFYPFRSNFAQPKGTKIFDDLPRLKMSARVLERKEKFWLNVLRPHMVTLLQDSNAVWSNWLEMLECGRIPEAEMDIVRKAWSEWWLEVSKRKTARRMMELEDTQDAG